MVSTGKVKSTTRLYLSWTGACAKAGARALYLNTDFAGPQVRDVCERERVEALVHDEEFGAMVDGVAAPRGRFLAWTDSEPDVPTLEQLIGDEGPAVASGEDEAARTSALRLLGEVQHLRDVRQVIQREADGVRGEVGELAIVVAVSEDLQIEQAHVVAGRAHGRRHALEPDRLEPQKDLRIHQRTGVHEQDFHRALLYSPSSRALWARAIAPSGPTRSPSPGATSSGAGMYPASTASSSVRTRARRFGARITPPPMAIRLGDSTATMAATPSAR